ncbi:MAG TPA: hypothetical protein VH143_08100 [Kofleriaceae bacterium]|nr:hypothetical protein [Kofleriaceae bacterium]
MRWRAFELAQLECERREVACLIDQPAGSAERPRLALERGDARGRSHLIGIRQGEHDGVRSPERRAECGANAALAAANQVLGDLGRQMPELVAAFEGRKPRDCKLHEFRSATRPPLDSCLSGMENRDRHIRTVIGMFELANTALTFFVSTIGDCVRDAVDLASTRGAHRNHADQTCTSVTARYEPSELEVRVPRPRYHRPALGIRDEPPHAAQSRDRHHHQ